MTYQQAYASMVSMNNPTEIDKIPTNTNPDYPKSMSPGEIEIIEGMKARAEKGLGAAARTSVEQGIVVLDGVVMTPDEVAAARSPEHSRQ